MTDHSDELPHAPLPVSAKTGTVRRVVIAEDRRSDADWLTQLLKTLRPRWTVCAVVPDPKALGAAIDEHVPDLLLLDVHLIGGTSLDVVHTLPYPMPIVFTSGDPTLAVDAFECAAVDYLLKPVRGARLERALQRVELTEPAKRPASTTPDESGWLIAQRGSGSVIVHFREIVYLQAMGKLTRVVTRDGEAWMKRGLGLVAQHLDARRFYRVHRSAIVNMNYAGTVVKDELGRMRLSMKGRGDWVDVSQPYEHLFRPS